MKKVLNIENLLIYWDKYMEWKVWRAKYWRVFNFENHEYGTSIVQDW